MCEFGGYEIKARTCTTCCERLDGDVAFANWLSCAVVLLSRTAGSLPGRSLARLLSLYADVFTCLGQRHNSPPNFTKPRWSRLVNRSEPVDDQEQQGGGRLASVPPRDQRGSNSIFGERMGLFWFSKTRHSIVGSFITSYTAVCDFFRKWKSVNIYQNKVWIYRASVTSSVIGL